MLCYLQALHAITADTEACHALPSGAKQMHAFESDGEADQDTVRMACC